MVLSGAAWNLMDGLALACSCFSMSAVAVVAAARSDPTFLRHLTRIVDDSTLLLTALAASLPAITVALAHVREFRKQNFRIVENTSEIRKIRAEHDAEKAQIRREAAAEKAQIRREAEAEHARLRELAVAAQKRADHAHETARMIQAEAASVIAALKAELKKEISDVRHANADVAQVVTSVARAVNDDLERRSNDPDAPPPPRERLPLPRPSPVKPGPPRT